MSVMILSLVAAGIKPTLAVICGGILYYWFSSFLIMDIRNIICKVATGWKGICSIRYTYVLQNRVSLLDIIISLIRKFYSYKIKI